MRIKQSTQVKPKLAPPWQVEARSDVVDREGYTVQVIIRVEGKSKLTHDEVADISPWFHDKVEHLNNLLIAYIDEEEKE